MGRQHILKIVFNKKVVKKDMYLALNDDREKKLWIKAFQKYQL